MSSHPFYGRTFVSGHSGAAYHAAGTSRWNVIESLKGKDVMAWAPVARKSLVGGHGGVFESIDQGNSFVKSKAVPRLDVHGLGASGRTVYLSSATEGVLRSEDGGATFVRRGSNPMIMGPILVDPLDTARAVAVDVHVGVIKTSNGGRSWSLTAGTSAAIAVACNPRNERELVIFKNGGAAISPDGGATWADLDVPKATVAATYTARGRLITAALTDHRAISYRRVNDGWRQVG